MTQTLNLPGGYLSSSTSRGELSSTFSPIAIHVRANKRVMSRTINCAACCCGCWYPYSVCLLSPAKKFSTASKLCWVRVVFYQHGTQTCANFFLQQGITGGWQRQRRKGRVCVTSRSVHERWLRLALLVLSGLERREEDPHFRVRLATGWRPASSMQWTLPSYLCVGVTREGHGRGGFKRRFPLNIFGSIINYRQSLSPVITILLNLISEITNVNNLISHFKSLK